MTIVWRPMAVTDREAIFDHIAQDNPSAALALDEDLSRHVELAARNPKLFKPGRVHGTREIVVRPNYVIVYRIEDDGALLVIRVLHAARQWP